MTKKFYVLDTNVLITDPNAITKFGEHDIGIPLKTLEELDKFKNEMTERGRAVRTISRHLDKFREKGNLFDGIQIERPDNSEAGKLYIIKANSYGFEKLPFDLNKTESDNIILASIFSLKEKLENREIIFVTQDVNLRIKCDVIGIKAENYRSAKATQNGGYQGFREIEVTSEIIDEFYKNDSEYDIKNSSEILDFDILKPNEYILLKTSYSNQTAICRYDYTEKKLKGLFKNSSFKNQKAVNVWGISPKNLKQQFALDALLDPNIHLVTLCGKAGSGKTLLALAAGLHCTGDENIYKRILCSRPIFPLGKDLGYLPGDLQEKLNPWMQPIYDNAELLLNLYDPEEQRRKKSHEELEEMGLLEIEAITYVRGRSIPKQYFIVDEAQNLTPHEIKTIVTRAGEGTKIVLTGDPEQIDNPLLDKSSNGLTYVVERFKNHPLAAHITLEKGERSILATVASEIL